MSTASPAFFEIIDFIAAGATSNAIADYRPSPEAQERVAELIEREKDHSLSPPTSCRSDADAGSICKTVWWISCWGMGRERHSNAPIWTDVELGQLHLLRQPTEPNLASRVSMTDATMI